MQLVKKGTAIFDRTLNLLFLVATSLLILITLTTITEIIMRTFWGRPIMGTVELTGYTLLFITFLGTAWLLREDGHVKMDVVLSRLRPRIQSTLNIITSILGAIICLVIAWYGVKVSWYSFQTNYRAISELEIPLFPILIVIPVGTFLLFIQFLRRTYGFLRKGRALGGQEQGL